MRLSRISWRSCSATALLLALVLPILAACGGGAPATSEPAATGGSDTGKFLVFGNSGEPDNIDTMDTFSGQALYVGIQAQELLIDLKPGTLDLVPRLATEWKPNADSTEWTLKLRQGVKFTDGTPFNADAVVFNFKRMADPKFEFGFRAGDTGKK